MKTGRARSQESEVRRHQPLNRRGRRERRGDSAKSQQPIARFYAAAFCDAAGGSGCGRARANMAQTQNQLNSANKYAKRKRKTTKTSSPPSVAVLGSSRH